MSERTLFTIGHSTRSWDEFLELLGAWKIKVLVDVRTIPKSRTFPWFAQDNMQKALPRAGIKYVHLRSLGGLRRARPESTNVAWQNASFRGFADYMQEEEFARGLEELNRLRRTARVCMMCSEAVWWRCHRRMIADAEVARGIPVKHVMTTSTATDHEATAFAVVTKKRGRPPRITYPAPQATRRAKTAENRSAKNRG